MSHGLQKAVLGIPTVPLAGTALYLHALGLCDLEEENVGHVVLSKCVSHELADLKCF